MSGARAEKWGWRTPTQRALDPTYLAARVPPILLRGPPVPTPVPPAPILTLSCSYAPIRVPTSPPGPNSDQALRAPSSNAHALIRVPPSHAAPIPIRPADLQLRSAWYPTGPRSACHPSAQIFIYFEGFKLGWPQTLVLFISGLYSLRRVLALCRLGPNALCVNTVLFISGPGALCVGSGAFRPRRSLCQVPAVFVC